MRRFSIFGWSRSHSQRRGHRPAWPVRFIPRLEALESLALPSNITVTSAADSGPGSLRSALAAAHANDHISFANSVHGITLASELAITKSVSIDGPGPDKLNISGRDVSRVFHVHSGVTASIVRLTIAHGHAYHGGGILNEAGAELDLDHVTLSDNVAQDGQGGGGIFNAEGATLTVGHSVLSDNRAVAGVGHDVFGGGVFNAGTATFSDTRFDGNRAIAVGDPTRFAGPYGGAIDNYGGDFHDGVVDHLTGAKLTVKNCAFTANSVFCLGGPVFLGECGGAIENDFGATADISNSTFTGNSATGGPGTSANGGAIDNWAATLTVTNCVLTGNRAVGGDGGDGVHTIDQGLGGAIMFLGGDFFGIPNTTVTVSNSIFAFNQAIGGDGGTEPGGFPPIGLGAGAGIGAYYPGARLKVVNCTFVSNQAIGGDNAVGMGGRGQGGGIDNDVFASATVVRCTFTGNAAIGGRGGAGSPGGYGAGGGLMVDYFSTAAVTNSTFSGNLALGGPGGAGGAGGFGYGGGVGVGAAISYGIQDTSSLTLDGCSVAGNQACGGIGGASDGGDGDGGGLSVLSGTVSVTKTDVTENRATGGTRGAGGHDGDGYGGGLYVGDPLIAFVSLTGHSVVRWNHATTDGDDIFEL